MNMRRVKPAWELEDAQRTELNRLTARIGEIFTQGGYAALGLPSILPAALYLDTAGEDIRQRMYLFEDPDGAELCLRADLTVPLCRRLLDDPSTVFPARRSYLGTAYRHQPPHSLLPTESLQAGIERLGDGEPRTAEAEVFALALEAVRAAGIKELSVTLGDVALFEALIADLGCHPIWRTRLSHAFRHPLLMPRVIAAARKGAGVTAAASDPPLTEEAALKAVETALSAGGELIGRRSAAEIAAGLRRRSEEARADPPGAAALSKIERFLAINRRLPEALEEVRALGGPATARVLATVAERLALFARHRQSEDEWRFSTALGRRFQYYSGFVFEFGIADWPVPLAAGGRYDGLLETMGAKGPVPAIGAALFIERLIAAGAP